MKNSGKFESGAVQRHANLVDLEKWFKNPAKWLFGRYRSCRYSRERASQSSRVISFHFSFVSLAGSGGLAMDAERALPLVRDPVEEPARGLRGRWAELLITTQTFSYSLKFEFDPNHPQTLRGSFSAVSTATIATKYSFFQVFRDLQDYYTFASLRSQKFSEKPSNFCWKFFVFFAFFDEICDFSAKFWWNFAREKREKICRNFTEMFRKWRTVSRFWEKLFLKVPIKIGKC